MLTDPAEELTLMKPALVPDVGAVEPIETVKDRGVIPLVGVTVSQLLAEAADTTTLTGELDVSRMLGEVVETPVCVLNVSCCGLALSAFCARAVSKQPTRASNTIAIEDSDLLMFFTISLQEKVVLLRKRRRAGRS